jgi:hypothetical protein
MTSSDEAPRWQRHYAAAMSGVIGWCIAYVTCDALAWPRLTYFPYDGSWDLVGGRAAPATMTFFGTVLWGVGGGAVGAALGAIGARLWRRPLPAPLVTLLGAWAITAFALAGLYYLWNLWPF